MLERDDHVVVVGAGLAGWRFAQYARRAGYAGRVTILGEEPYAPYDRPPLSKQVLRGVWPIEQCELSTMEERTSLDVDLRRGEPAVALDVEGTTVTLASGECVSGSHVVIATGVSARELPFSAARELHRVRSRDDVVRLNDALGRLAPGDPIALIGGGFIGAEVATALHARGLRPVVFEAAERPLLAVLGDEVSTWLADVPASGGVEVRTRQHVTDVTRESERFRLYLDTNETFDAALVVVGVGAVANTNWLHGADVEVDNGVVVNEQLLAHPRVGAIGDVARFRWVNPLGTESVRLEHWQIANDHAAALANLWVTGDRGADLLPYFWSDQYGKKIQVLGHPHPTDEVALVAGAVREKKWLALYHRDGLVTGVVGLSQPRAVMMSKAVLAQATTLDAARREQPWAS